MQVCTHIVYQSDFACVKAICMKYIQSTRPHCSPHNGQHLTSTHTHQRVHSLLQWCYDCLTSSMVSIIAPRCKSRRTIWRWPSIPATSRGVDENWWESKTVRVYMNIRFATGEIPSYDNPDHSPSPNLPRGIPCCYNQGPTQRVVAKYDIIYGMRNETFPLYTLKYSCMCASSTHFAVHGHVEPHVHNKKTTVDTEVYSSRKDILQRFC